LDSRWILVMGRLDPSSGRISLHTCYRRSPRRTNDTEWLDILREMNGHRRGKTLVEVQVA
jgi:hypothetical protein